METIHRRTVFFEIDDTGIHRFCDWARTTTNIGTMLEPCTQLFNRVSPGVAFDDYDMADEMCMVTAIEGIDLDREKYIIGDAVTGGYLMPRTGR